MKTKHFLIFLIGFLILLNMFFLLSLLGSKSDPSNPSSNDPTLPNAPITFRLSHPLPSATDITATNITVPDNHVETVTEQWILGKWSLFYFGYTFCPDVCPTSLAFSASALSQLSKEELDHLKFIFISVDPERDSLEKTITYVQHFHPQMEVLWGNLKDIQPLTQQVGVIFEKHFEKGKNYYTVDHSAFTTLVNPKGQMVHRFDHGTPPNEMVRILRDHINGNNSK